MRTWIVLWVCLGMSGAVATSHAANATPATSGSTRSPLAPAPADAGPDAVIWRLFDRFEHRDVEGYIAPMADDYRFDSDDADFRAAHPAGMDRDAERAFATHLFVGGGRAANGGALPVAVNVEETVGPMHVTLLEDDGSHAVVRIGHYRVRVTFADGSGADLGESDNVVELVREDGAWRVRRWHETPAGAEPDSGAVTRATAVKPGAPVLRLALAAGVARGGELRLDLTLPAPGGRLELFDVQGRRLDERVLDGLAAGTHAVALGRALPAGVYWARLRQGRETVSARVVWMR